MARLTFVGLGLGPRGISLEGVEELRTADVVYLEYYTTPHEPTLLRELQSATGAKITVVDRDFVEDGRRILEEAGTKKVALAVLGDPMIATTHDDLRTRAIRAGVETTVVHSASIASAAASASGLHYYKFSRTTTVTRESVNKLSQVYHLLHQNLLEGAHTLLLLEYDQQSGEGVSPADAVAGLLLAEANFKRGVVTEETFGLVESRLGRENSAMAGGSFAELGRKEFGDSPHSLVVPGKLHFTEVESVSAIFSLAPESVRGNSDSVLRTAQSLVPKYVEKTRKALSGAASKLGPSYSAVLENAELYLRDAERNLAEGEDEIAMLNVGYAEGLLDALGFAGLVKVEW
ncbi:MAG: diphthine synthase [archaeon]|nr:MAG: diphthine synthase [archaeon]